MLTLNELAARVAIVDKDGVPTPQFQIFWQAMVEALRDAQARLDAAGL